MKIAIVFPRDSEAIFDDTSSRTFGGATVQLFLIARELFRHSDIKTYSLIADYPQIRFSDRDKFNLITVYPIRAKALKIAWQFHKKITALKPDVLLVRGLTGFACLLALYCRLLGVRMVYMLASDVESQGRYQRSNKPCRLFRLLLANASVLISQNKYQQARLKNAYGKQSQILYSGYEIGEPPVSKENIALWVGRCDPMKHAELFIRLAEKNPAIKFILVCPPGADTAHNDEIIRSAETVKNLEYISFLPFQQIDDFFKRAKVFINTSDYEGYPQTFIQAAKNCTPILSLNADPNGFIANRDCGFVTRGDFEELNDKLRLLFSDPITYQRQSSNAYQYAKKFHDIRTTVEKLLSLLKNHKAEA